MVCHILTEKTKRKDVAETCRKNRKNIENFCGTLWWGRFILIYETMKDHIPDEIFVYADEETDWETFFREPLISYDETVEVSQNGSYQIRCKWLGVLPLKTIKVHTVEKQEVLVSGSPVGIYMETKGVLVIDSGEITDREGIRRTPAEHIIQSGDYICEIDGKVLTEKAADAASKGESGRTDGIAGDTPPGDDKTGNDTGGDRRRFL